MQSFENLLCDVLWVAVSSPLIPLILCESILLREHTLPSTLASTVPAFLPAFVTCQRASRFFHSVLFPFMPGTSLFESLIRPTHVIALTLFLLSTVDNMPQLKCGARTRPKDRDRDDDTDEEAFFGKPTANTRFSY